MSCGHRLKDGATDKLGDLRDYGVSASGKAVCPIGNPISHSGRIGLIQPSTRYGTHLGSHLRSKLILQPLGRVSPRDFRCIVSIENGAKPLDLFGVGHKPNPVAQMWSADSCRWYAVPLRIIPDLGQVSENSTKPSARSFAGATKKTSDVLHDDELRSYLANEADDFAPEAGPLTVKSRTPTSDGYVLAGKSARNDVNGNSIGSKPLCGEGSHVIVTGDLGPMLRQHTAGEGFDFAEGDRLESARPLKAEGEAANTRKQIEYFEFLSECWLDW